jgi:hypothetical protein
LAPSETLRHGVVAEGEELRQAEWGDGSGVGIGEMRVTIVLEKDSRLSLMFIISTGAPRSHTSHKWRSVQLSRARVQQLSQIKNSFFIVALP